jgi:hypothetical protein
VRWSDDQQWREIHTSGGGKRKIRTRSGWEFLRRRIMGVNSVIDVSLVVISIMILLCLATGCRIGQSR